LPQTPTQIATSAVQTITSSTSTATNFNTGTVIRSLVDSFAVESSVQQQQTEDLFAVAVLNVLSGMLGLPPIGATGSVYALTFTLSASAPVWTYTSGTAAAIPLSTLQWVIGQSGTLQPGQSVTLTGLCSSTGSITNVPANSITQMVVPVSGLTVTNESSTPVVPGQDAPTQVQIQAQIANQLEQIQKGIGPSIEAAAVKSQITDASGNPTEQVVKAKWYDGVAPGTGYCYVFNGVGSMSTALLTQTKNLLYGYTDTNGTVVVGPKPGGCFLYVVDAPQTPLSVTAAVYPANGYTLAAVQTGVQAAIQNYLAQLGLGETFSVTALATAIRAVPGVGNVQILSPSADQPATPYVAPPGAAPVPVAITPGASTSLAAGTYQVGITYTNPWGETTVSALGSVTLTAGQAIQIPAQTLAVGATGVSYYLSQEGGASVTFALSGNGAQETLTALPAAGAASPPTSNTALINGNVYVLSGVPTIQQASS